MVFVRDSAYGGLHRRPDEQPFMHAGRTPSFPGSDQLSSQLVQALGAGGQKVAAPQADGPGHITLSEARSRLDRSRFSRPRPHFLAFFKIYKKITFSRANSGNFCQKIGKFCKNFDVLWQILQNVAKFAKKCRNFWKKFQFFGRNLQNLLARR